MSKNSTLLDLFKEQLTNQVPNIMQSLELETEGEAFAYWYFTHILDQSDLEAKEQICEGGGDLGIDALTVNENEACFYQFKNPRTVDKGIKAGEVDKLISGLEVIIGRNYEKIANEELKERFKELYSVTPSKYIIFIVTSGNEPIPEESIYKLDNFCEKHGGPLGNLFSWNYEDLSKIHEKFYASNIPTLSAKVTINSERMPYMAKIGDHETYMLHLSGKNLAELYREYGEQLLQQNVRMFEGNVSTNLAIKQTATSDNSGEFFHFNNGITIICDGAVPLPFSNGLEMERPQVVNGGQTIRILNSCLEDGTLKEDVFVAIRVITTKGDKDFASNVAVNLNNQTRIDSAFLRSNDPRIVQLQHSLSADGWHLERRSGEIESLTESELVDLEAKYGSPLAKRTIPLKLAMQSYVATVYADPQLAKKDPNKIFTDADGGHFSKIMNSGITAELFINSFELFKISDIFVENFKKLKRKRYSKESDRKAAYTSFLGTSFVNNYFSYLDPCIPQSTIFLTALIYQKFVVRKGKNYSELVDVINSSRKIKEFTSVLGDIIETQKLLPDKSWPTLLKSRSFFNSVLKRMKETDKHSSIG